MEPTARTTGSLSESYGESLLAAAREARERAWCPYSKFRVGVALLTESGLIFSGCNVENASFGLTICAERTAAVKAVSEGHHVFTAMAVVTASDKPLLPCGACRQFLAEFGLDLPIVAEGTGGTRIETSLRDLLPAAFTPSDLPAPKA
jgi:cytidine deaminase